MILRALLWARLHYISGQKLSQLPPQLRELAEKYRAGIAEALGVSPGKIRESIVYKWATHFYEAFTGEKPPAAAAELYTYAPKKNPRGGIIY